MACAWPSIAEPFVTNASTSAIATRIFTVPPAMGSATESWSRSRESSLSMDAQSRARKSRIAASDAMAGRVIRLASAMTAGEKSGRSPRWSITACAMTWSWSLPLPCAVAMEWSLSQGPFRDIHSFARARSWKSRTLRPRFTATVSANFIFSGSREEAST